MYTTENTELHTWFERDRAHIRLQDECGDDVLELWDEEVQEAVEDGFLSIDGFILGRCIDSHALHQSACELVNSRN